MIRFGLLPVNGVARYVYIGPDTVDVSALTLADIARGLGGFPRFGNQTPFPYSVARHSVILTALLHKRGHRGDLLREAMLHDAPEALGVNDVQHFVKREYGKELKGLERRLMQAVYAKFIGPVPPWVIDPIVDAADKRLGAVEAVYFGWDVEGFEPRADDPDLVREFFFDGDYSAESDAAVWMDWWEAIY